MSDRADDTGASWPAVLTFRQEGCWLVTGELGATVVRVVVSAR